MNLQKEYFKYVAPYLESATKISGSSSEKRIIDGIIFKKINVENITQANDIPDFRNRYGEMFINIAVNRIFQKVLLEEYIVKVVNGERILHFKNKEIKLNYFEVGSLPLIDFQFSNHLFIGFKFNHKKFNTYIFGELNIPLKSKCELDLFISENTILGGKYFTSFHLLKDFKYD